jgi:hypothetical protein
MIRHQAVGIRQERQFFFLNRQQREKFPIVLLVMKDVSSLDPASYQMIHTPSTSSLGFRAISGPLYNIIDKREQTLSSRK